MMNGFMLPTFNEFDSIELFVQWLMIRVFGFLKI
jgi:hypothetical protein